ncbi:putative MFS family arabinose efflux permease [Xanthomonas arboricola]|uniref:MFS transporter n=1 Tax=Xanthomonas euroxanthea TaxID=2259622 RepID=UPI0014313628|nr:MFS transporter [Xanthomonas euroxanthea]NJC37453.1 putative MFS family arabinose efflux permease [Xanthomonas euroxanthea]
MSLVPGSSARAQQHATRAAFFIPGFAAAIWAVLVPFAKARTGVDDGALGLILLCLGAGSFLAMPLAGALSARFGFRAVMAVTAALICISLPLLAVFANPWVLGAVLFAFGAGVGAMDCAMNMQAVVVERDARRAMMSGFHAFFSIGGFVGAGAMTLLLSARVSPLSAALAGVIAMLVVGVLSVRHWRTERVAQQGPLLALPRGIVLFIGILAFVVFLAEGTILDWSSVFLADVHQVAPSTAGVGYVAFALTMTVTRLLGDAVVERLGRIRSIVVGALLASAGFLVLTLVSPWQASLAGYVLVGLGCANIVPALFSLAGNQTRMPESIAITAVTTLGYAGILAGPALIGFAAHGIGLVGALLGVAVLMVGVAVSTRWLRV